MVALDGGSGRVVGVGQEAVWMEARGVRGVRVVRPARDGVVADIEGAMALVRVVLGWAHGGRWKARPKVAVTVAAGATAVHRQAVERIVELAGARKVVLVEKALAAVGVEEDPDGPAARMIVDLGAGTTEIAVVALGAVVEGRTLRVGGDELDRAVAAWARKEHRLLISAGQAGEAKIRAGKIVAEGDGEVPVELAGKDARTGRPQLRTVAAGEITEAYGPAVERIVDAVRVVRDACPPDLAVDLLTRGVTLSGGGAQLPGLAQRLEERTDLPVTLADDPGTVIVRGAVRRLQRPSRRADEQRARLRAMEAAGTADRGTPAPEEARS
ncbi:rod shape-determining protein [Actinocorallia lasiicapitis]